MTPRPLLSTLPPAAVRPLREHLEALLAEAHTRLVTEQSEPAMRQWQGRAQAYQQMLGQLGS